MKDEILYSTGYRKEKLKQIKITCLSCAKTKKDFVYIFFY